MGWSSKNTIKNHLWKWLEDDPSLLKWPLFRGHVSFRRCICHFPMFFELMLHLHPPAEKGLPKIWWVFPFHHIHLLLVMFIFQGGNMSREKTLGYFLSNIGCWVGILIMAPEIVPICCNWVVFHPRHIFTKQGPFFSLLTSPKMPGNGYISCCLPVMEVGEENFHRCWLQHLHLQHSRGQGSDPNSWKRTGAGNLKSFSHDKIKIKRYIPPKKVSFVLVLYMLDLPEKKKEKASSLLPYQ